MSKSYQHEVPTARINITLDVETGGNKAKKELPMKLLMLGNYSNDQAKGSIASRDRATINKHNFDQVLADFSPQVDVMVKNCLQKDGEELPIHLQFKAMSDFRPEHIIEQVPALQRLMAMRNLLKDLKACIIDNHLFRKELEKIMKDTTSAKRLLQDLSEQATVISD